MLAADLALVQVGFGGIHCHDRHVETGQTQPGASVAVAERVLEPKVPHIAGVMVPRNEHHLTTGNSRQLVPGDGVLIGIPVIGDVPRDNHEIRFGGVDLGDGSAQQFRSVTGCADMHIRNVRDQHRPRSLGIELSKGQERHATTLSTQAPPRRGFDKGLCDTPYAVRER